MALTRVKDEPKFFRIWRPLVAYVYIVVCIFDFVIFPLLWSLLQMHASGTVTLQWQPLTLQNGAFFHFAMGGIIGVTAHGRTKEKLQAAQLSAPDTAPTSTAPVVNTNGKPGPVITDEPQ